MDDEVSGPAATDDAATRPATPPTDAAGTDPAATDPAGTDPAATEPSAAETRSARRARREAREALLREPVLPPLATVPRPWVVVGTVVVCGLLALGAVADPVLLAAGLAWTGLLLSWGWPALLGSSSRFGSSLAIGVAGVLAPAAAAAATDPPHLRLVPVAVIAGLVLMFGHQLVRRDGRPRLTESLAVTSFALALVTVGTTWVPLARGSRAADLAVVALAAVAAGSLADAGAGVDRLRPWLLPLAMALGGGTAMVAATALGSPDPGPAALAGLLVAAVSHAVRRVLTVLPAVGSVRSQLSVVAAGILLPGVVAYVVGIAVVG